jgi:hypothetical protein
VEDIKKRILERYETRLDIEGLVLMQNTERFPFHTNEYDYYVLAIYSSELIMRKVEHLEIENVRVFIRTVHQSDVENSAVNVSRYQLMDWLISGEIIADRNGLMLELKQHILKFPNELRNQRKFKEYCGFLETLFQAKRNLSTGNALDAYSQILIAIHHWARIVLIEEGLHPELTVWKQMRKVHPGIYKLYEELIASPETVEQRVELVMLACEFSAVNKMKSCCLHLLDIMKEKADAWSISELQSHSKLRYLVEDMTLVVQKLVKGHLLKEVAAFSNDEVNEMIELRYILI